MSKKYHKKIGWILVFVLMTGFIENAYPFERKYPHPEENNLHEKEVLLNYTQKVRDKFTKKWVLSDQFIGNPKKLNASFTVHIDKTGKITSISLEKDSGDEDFNSSCLKAIKKVRYLPKPPKPLEWEVYNEGFLIVFDPAI